MGANIGLQKKKTKSGFQILIQFIRIWFVLRTFMLTANVYSMLINDCMCKAFKFLDFFLQKDEDKVLIQ
jgi:hypothetical protein